MEVSPTAKSPTIKAASVVNIVTPATSGNDKEAYLYESSFGVGSIVSIDGRGLDRYMFRNRDTAPTFYCETMTVQVLT